MTDERLRELRQDVIFENRQFDTEYVNHNGTQYAIPVDNGKLTQYGQDLLALIDSALSKPQTKFEVWKQGLTLEGEAKRRQKDTNGTICYDCPAREYCDQTGKNKNSNCDEIFKEWGEQDADSLSPNV